jgi:hypothetical protein
MVRRHTAYYLAATMIACLIVPNVTALAQTTGQAGIGFDAEAQTGPDKRRVRFRFFCSSNAGPNVTGVLSVQLEVTRYQQLRSVFDFDPFEGPDAKAGSLSRLQTTGLKAKASDSFSASGSVLAAGMSPGSTEAFMLEVSASRRDNARLRKLIAVLRPLMDGPGQLTWRQGNIKAAGAPISATLDIGQAQYEQLKPVLGPCLTAR